MPDLTAHRHPVLVVRCRAWGVPSGRWCRRPSGYRVSDLHAARRAEADRVFIEQHSPTAAIIHAASDWLIDPYGRAPRLRRAIQPRKRTDWTLPDWTAQA